MKSPIKTYGPQWHAARQSYIGASEMAAICGLDPWSTPEDVAESKYYPENKSEIDTSPNSPIWWGHRDEPAIVEATKHLLRPTAQPWEVRTGLSWVDEEHGIMASPDGVFLNGDRERTNITDAPTEALEVKSVGRAAARWQAGPPIYVIFQGHTQIALLGPHCERVHIAARIGGTPVKVWTIERDELLIAAIKTIAKTWWENYRSMGVTAWSSYAARTLADAGFSYAEPIKRNNNSVASDSLDLFDQWREARQQARDWKEKQASLGAEVLHLLGDADTLTDLEGNPLIRRSWVNRAGIDIKALCADHPDLEEKYSYPMTHQRLSEVRRRPTQEEE